MPYIIDEIKEGNVDTNPALEKVFKDAITVDIQNVMDYFSASEQEAWRIEEDFPCVIPSFRTTWFESRIPRKVFRNKRWENTSEIEGGHRIGHLIGSFEGEDKTHLVFVRTWHEYAGKVWELPFTLTYVANPDGTMRPYETHPEYGGRFYRIYGGDEFLARYQKLSEKEKQDMLGFMSPVLLAISFMNCKNVTNKVLRESPEALNAKRARIGRPPITKVYTLVIDGIQKILRANSEGSESLTGRALHICRGHFKDFTHGAGLFGRYKGRYWWPMQTRGSTEFGEVVKGYEVAVPK